MLNPQSKTNADSGLNNSVSDFRAASWIAVPFDIFERRAELKREVNLSRELPINVHTIIIDNGAAKWAFAMNKRWDLLV
jgi:hypothetical protein